MPDIPQLRRAIGLGPLIVYGVGTMVGGGFYALLGKVAGLAGLWAPAALLMTGSLAFLSALSFAELSARFPVSAGEVRYVSEGFGHRGLSILVGYLVIVTGIVSAAMLAVASVGFLHDLVPVPQTFAIVLLVLALGAVAGGGIGQSVGLVFAITVIEVGGLVAATVLASDSLGALPARWRELVPPVDPRAWTGILSGSFLAFYAFLGFEDMVNIAEEVRNPRRNLPIAILVSVVVTTGLYVAIALVGVLTVEPARLATANTPIAAIVGRQGPGAMTAIGLVSLLAGINGALVQIVMASRVAYGMSRRGKALAWLGRVHRVTRTPLAATALMTAAVATLAASFPLTALARATSAIILIVFAAVNLSLWHVKRGQVDSDVGDLGLPRWLPLVAAGSCVAILLFQAWIGVT